MGILNAVYAPIYEGIEEVVLHWYKRKVIGGRSFEELFEVEGFPLGWFYEKIFFTVMMPKYLNIYDILKNKKNLTFLKKSELLFYSSILPKLVLFNERKKITVSRKKSRTPTQQQKVLLLTFTNHLQSDGKIYRFQSIIDELFHRNKTIPLPVTVDPFSSRKYQELKTTTTIYQYSDKEIVQKANKKSKEMYQQIHSLSEEQKRNIFSTKDKNFWLYYKYLFNFHFSKEMLFQLFFHYYLFDKIIREEKIICALLTSPSSITEKCLIAAAKNNNIPALVVQHGMGLFHHPFNENRGNPHFAVFGEYHYKQTLDSGITKKNIHVTGPVIYNDIFAYKGRDSEKKRKSGKEIKEIIITTQNVVEVDLITKKEYFESLKKIIVTLQSIPKVKITIKTHPQEIYLQDYDGLAHQFRNVSTNHLKGNGNLYTLLSQCDLLINFYGTSTVLEAAILDKPSITIDLPNLTQNFYQDYDPSCRIKYNDNIKEKVQELLENPALLQEKRKKLVKEWCYLVDGKAHKRVVDLIEKLSRRIDS